MTINTLQNKIDEWIKTYGVRYFDIKTNGLILMEEVGELARVISRKYGEQSFKDGENTEVLLEDELADVLFVLTCIANQTGINLTKAMEKNLAKKTDRDQLRHKNNPKISNEK